jgi:hypothetical protein
VNKIRHPEVFRPTDLINISWHEPADILFGDDTIENATECVENWGQPERNNVLVLLQF